MLDFITHLEYEVNKQKIERVNKLILDKSITGLY